MGGSPLGEEVLGEFDSDSSVIIYNVQGNIILPTDAAARLTEET